MLPRPRLAATATSIREATPIAPANVTLTAIRETAATDKRAAQRVQPMLPPSATLGADGSCKNTCADTTSIQEATPIAPANLTSTAIRETVIAAASPTDVAATPEPTGVATTATSIREATPIAPANLTLTAIRATVIAGGKSDGSCKNTRADRCRNDTRLRFAEATPIAPANLKLTAVRETVRVASSPTDVAATPEPTELATTATSIREATPIAPANVTLTAIRATDIAAASPTDVAATPELTEVSAPATSIREATPIAPANMTLTAIRETVKGGGKSNRCCRDAGADGS